MTAKALRLRATSEPAASVSACVGEDAEGRRWAWYSSVAPELAPGTQVETPAAGALSCPAGLADEEILTLLRAWPAWRLARLAGLEIGSGLLVAGDDSLARRVLEMGRLRGCLWTAVHGASWLRDAADHWIDPQAQTGESVLKALPARPDAAIVVCEDVSRFVSALAVCRDRGTVVLALSVSTGEDLDFYPDAHRRGLRIVGCRPFGTEDPCQEWPRDAARLHALWANGALARP